MSGSEEQLSPLNYEEFAYQQQLIEELIQENKDLKGKLEDAEAHLATTEAKLQRSNQLIREMANIKEEMHMLKRTADRVE